MKWGRQRRRIGARHTQPALAALAVLSLPAVSAQWSGGLSLGLDTNPAQRRSGVSLAFVRYELAGRTGLALEDTELDLALTGNYRDYAGGGDDYRLDLTGDWSRPLDDGRSRLTLSLDTGFYRDRLVPADERDEAAAGLRFDRVISASSELSLSAELRWLGYRNASLPWAGRPGGNGVRPGPHGPGTGHAQQPTRRDDILAALSAGSTYFPGPATAVSVSFHHHRLYSQVEQESYRQTGAGLGARWEPLPDWQFRVTLDWYRRGYGGPGHRLEREDDRLDLGASLRRFLGGTELYLAISHTDNDSSLRQKTFRQTVTECGIARTF